jgi:hypothetical protein
MTRWALALAAVFAAFTAQAQTPEPRSKPAASEEQRQKVRAARHKAAQACKGTRGDARHECMEREMCAQATDPAKCNARVSKLRGAHQKAVETCKSAQPDKHRDCMRHELCAHAKDPVQCEARAKQRAERRKARN